MAKAASSEKREYKTPESAIRQKKQWEAKGYKVTRRGNVLHLKREPPPEPEVPPPAEGEAEGEQATQHEE